MPNRQPRLSLRSTGAVFLILTLLLGIVAIQAAVAAEPQPEAADSALGWLRSQQLEDGAFPGVNGEADLGTTTDVIFAFAAAGVDPATVGDGASVVDYLTGAVASPELSNGQLAKVVMALVASNVDPRNVGGRDLVADIQSGFDPATGLYDVSFYAHALIVMGLASAGVEVNPAALDAIDAAQIEDGSWSFTGAPDPVTGDSNTTALIIQALVAAGRDDGAVDAGVEYLRSLQAADGSIAYDASAAPDLAGDANSTALAIQAFVAAGEDPDALPNGSAVEALLTFQKDNGAFFWQAAFGTDDNLLATVQAIPALLLAPLPVNPVPSEPGPEPGGDPLEDALAPAQPIEGCEFHEVTSHNVCDNFQLYWQENGGLKILGYPLTEAFTGEDGVTIQYFERARMELHPGAWPENHDILLGRLGAEVIEDALGQ